MNVLLFGASGMVGDGVLHECLADDRVGGIVAIVRSPLKVAHPKLREILQEDFSDYSMLSEEFGAADACFFCLGVSSVGMSEADYTRLTYDLTLAAASELASAHPGAVFCYVSGEGTDSSEAGRTMWARVKGRTENALLRLPLEAYMFRPGFIRPRRGKRSKTLAYRIIYAIVAPAYPLLKLVAGSHVTTVENVGRAMLSVASSGYPKRVLGNSEINLAAGSQTR